jgi:hypothetical protein
MNIVRLISLIRCDFPMLWGALGLSIIYGYMNATQIETDHMFSLSLYGPEVFLLMIPFMSLNALFLSGNFGVQNLKTPAYNSLEFFFTRAIHRSSIFGVKATVYLLLSLMPLLTVWAYSYTKPVIRIELPYNTQAHREATKQFYLNHFNGAYVQKDEKDKEGNKFWVVLPKGQVDRAIFTLMWVFACTLFSEVMLFAFFQAKPRIFFLTYFLLLIVTMFGGSSIMAPSYYETGLGWVSQHTFFAFLGLLALTTLSQLYCCRKFINTEITS